MDFASMPNILKKVLRRSGAYDFADLNYGFKEDVFGCCAGRDQNIKTHWVFDTSSLKTTRKLLSRRLSVSPDEKVLVTGASGFVASHTIKQLQDAGYSVRGTVRSLSDAKKIAPLYQLSPNAAHPLELVEADLLKQDGWLEAVAGCTYVLHIASPFPSTIPDDEQVLIKPAVEGTLTVLRECAAAGCVKRVVLTSSVAAIVGQTFPDYEKTYTEADWSDLGQEISAYQKSKTMAEKAAWEFVESLPEDKRFELAVINPTYVMGPICHGSTGTSQEVLGRLMRREIPALPNISFEICDVRDVALAHIRAMTLPEAAGKRFIVDSGGMWFKDMASVVKEEFGSQGYSVPTMMAPKFLLSIMSWFDKSIALVLPRWGKQLKLDNSQMRQVLGIEPYDKRVTIVDMAYSMIEHGMVPRAKGYTGQADQTDSSTVKAKC